MKKRVLPAILAMLLTGCTELSDLYDTSEPVMHIEGSWAHSLDQHEMMNATTLLYKEGAIRKEFLSRPNGVTVDVSRGDYDVLIFNGIMESEEELNLDHVYFRGTDRLETFEACALEGRPLRRLTRAEGEFIASNNMELLTFSHRRITVEGDKGYFLKYKNGKNGYPKIENHVEGTVSMVARAVSYRFMVRMTGIVNPRSSAIVSGALRGFSGSVFMPQENEKPRHGTHATHHLNLTPPSGSRVSMGNDGLEVGTVESPAFVTFGPTLPENDDLGLLPVSGEYFFEPLFVLIDGSEFSPGPIDITRQVNEAIETICTHHCGEGDIANEENLFIIEIDRRLTLPSVVGGEDGIDVDVDPWDDDETVIVWITP